MPAPPMGGRPSGYGGNEGGGGGGGGDDGTGGSWGRGVAA